MEPRISGRHAVEGAGERHGEISGGLLLRGREGKEEGDGADRWGLAASEMGGRGAERRAGKAGTGRSRELGRALVAGPARDSTGLAKKGKGERVTRLGWRAG